MTDEQVGGYLFLAGYAVVFLAAVRLFGLRRVMTFVLGIFVIGVAIAMSSLRAITDRR